MNKKVKIIAAIAGFAVVIALTATLYYALSQNTTLQDNSSSLFSSLTNLSSESSGGSLSSESSFIFDPGSSIGSSSGSTTKFSYPSSSAASSAGSAGKSPSSSAARPSSSSTVSSSSSAPLNKGSAPDFTVQDANGKNVNRSNFVGHPVVINFWASWCPPCRAEMPEFQNMYNQYSSKGVVFMMVNMTDGSRETISTAKSFLQSNNYTFSVFFDVNHSAGQAYGITSIPQTFFIDKSGNVSQHRIGQIDAATLENGIKSIL